MGRLFHAGRQVDRVTHGRVFDPQVGPNLADHHQAGVDSHPHAKIQIPSPLNFGLIGLDPLDNVQSGEHGTLGVVFMGDRCAEKGEDGITHEAGHRAFIAVDGRDQVLKGPVHDVGPLLGVQLFCRGG